MLVTGTVACTTYVLAAQQVWQIMGKARAQLHMAGYLLAVFGKLLFQLAHHSQLGL